MRRANGTGHVFKMKGGGRRNPWRVRITVGWELDEVTGKSKQNEDELSYAVKYLYNSQGWLMTEARIDIIHTLRQALKGVPDSVRNLASVVKEYPVVGDCVRVILSSGKDLDDALSA